VPLDGTTFVLGTFTHKNFPVYAINPNQFDVSLKVHVTFQGGVLSRDFSFKFHHFETPNVGPAPEDLVDRGREGRRRAGAHLLRQERLDGQEQLGGEGAQDQRGQAIVWTLAA
jgi:hypothetical protein